MKKAAITGKIGKVFYKTRFQLKKHSPEILVVTGVVGVVVSTVMACKATLKARAILDTAKEDIDAIHECAENEATKDEYTPDDLKKDLTKVYILTGVRFAKLYAPSVIIGALSIGSILTSHAVLRRRNIAMAAAYSAVDHSFKEYRQRVVERFGKDIDRELRHNIKAKSFEETSPDENGKEKTVEKSVNVADPNIYSDYARFFDESCECWEKDSEYNLLFLRAQQQYANDKLKAQGYLFLNDVYDMLGIPRTKAGQIVGWVFDDKHPLGDNYVDFGIYEVNRESNRAFVNGYERTILLDFNVDGNILEYIWEERSGHHA